ncbi:MAG: methylated-DNA--[protein]-cysteine S-methyltransferase [Desulfobacterales bacterium]|nr:methylated-DNA--[protein]-cysteine S-methyltransferase [Desulfobacterales bacterium]MCP4159933.1 methylated-DNA--[protein]-cysteine S-methyltransferase [Deltaproteobacteria bacterium]
MYNLTFEEKYEAIGKNGSEYEGIFITAVKTTGIFCRPSCRARKPKKENVIFYESTKEALQFGFRPCKVCKPMDKLSETPDYISKIVKELHENPYLRIKDYDLKLRDVNPAQIRRWFKKHHNMTFHGYQRMLRINIAYSSIQKGETITNSAFDSGFESLSGFNESYRSIFGDSPTKSNDKTVINIVRFTTPVGPMYACATSKGICLLEFTDRRMLETEFKDLCKRLKAVILPGENKHLKQVQEELMEYFDGKRKVFTVELHTPGTEFQNSVWKILQHIPYGEVRSYKEQAIAIGNPKAVRAVASANGHNRVGIIIPCHRVIGSDGSLVGYGGGLHRKQWLLDLEKDNK